MIGKLSKEELNRPVIKEKNGLRDRIGFWIFVTGYFAVRNKDKGALGGLELQDVSD